MSRPALTASLALLLFLATGTATAASELAFAKPVPADIWKSSGFRYTHPDLNHRLAAQAHFEDGRHAQAIVEFEKAARFGDKLSQAMLAEMHQKGLGTKVDLPTAYAWADLAAERGFLPFVQKREHLWAQLDGAQRTAAIAIGTPLYAEYGDEVARPRLAARLTSERRFTAGTRTGASTGTGSVVLSTGDSRILFNMVGFGNSFVRPHASGGNSIPMDVYYSPTFWHPDRYEQWQSNQLELTRRGLVTVGEESPAGAR
jgi:hypothetical protein